MSAAFFGLFVILQGTFSAYWYDLSIQEVNRYRSEEHWGYLVMTLFPLVPALLWHSIDLFRRSEVPSYDQSLICSYKLILSLLLYSLVGIALIASGAMEVVDCWHPPIPPSEDGYSFGFMCTPDPIYGFVPLVLLPALLLFALAIAKAFLTIKLSIKKTP